MRRASDRGPTERRTGDEEGDGNAGPAAGAAHRRGGGRAAARHRGHLPAGAASADIPIESWNNTGASAGDTSGGSSPHIADIHIGSWNSTGADYHRPPTVS
ncbi:hypothetical protein ACFQ1I_33415 [Kitasatospora arboriphila]